MSITIKSFDEFSKLKAEQDSIALENEQNSKREQNASVFKNLLSEYKVDSISSLSPEQKKEFYAKLEEGNAFGDAVRKAKEAGEKEFEFQGKTYKVEESLVNEAIIVTGKRDAKKVLTAYTKFFERYPALADKRFAGLHLGSIKTLMVSALEDANFHREAPACGRAIKGAKVQPVFINPIELNKTEVKIPVGKLMSILDDNASLISGAAGWSGIGIVEGTALYLESIKANKLAEDVLAAFNSAFEGEQVRVDVEARINEAKVLEAAAWEIGKDYPSYGVVVSVTHNDDLCEVTFDSGDKIVFRDTGSSWVQEAVVTESHFKVGDKVKCKDSGKTGEVVKLDKEDGADDEKYYTVKVDGGGEMKYAPNELTAESRVNEAKFVKDFNRDVLNAKTKEEVLELYPNAEFFIGKSDHFFGELDDNLFFKAYYTKAQQEFEIKSVYSEKNSNYVHLYNESVVTENYEVIYSDGISAMKKFRSEAQAIDFMKKEIASNKKLRDIAVYKPGMHSTTQTELVVAFWGDRSYLDNVSKRDPKLAAKKLEESVVTEAEIKSDEEFQEYAFTVLKKAFGDDFDETKAGEVVDGILSKSDGDYGAAVGMLTSSLG